LTRAIALGGLAAVTVAVVVLSGGRDGTGRCKSIDFQAFRESQAGGPGSPRFDLAARMIDCGALQRRSRAEVRRLLGRRTPVGGTRDEWSYELGQGSAVSLDESQLLVVFRGDRVIKARIVVT